MIKLGRSERIIAVVPEYAAGPGWANQCAWVYIEHTPTKLLRTVCLQPDEQPPELMTLFRAGAAMHVALVGAVAGITKMEKK